MRFAYADPPYPGTAARYYGKELSYAGEVDHEKLVESIVRGGFDGWALSTSARSLFVVADVVRRLEPRPMRVLPWVKPGGAPPASRGLHNVWEPLIVVGGRQKPPGVRDALVAHPARLGGELPGRKPSAFCAWLFDALGLEAGDSFADLFSGSGIVGNAARSIGASLLQTCDASPPQADDVSALERGDASPAADRDTSSVDGRHVT